MNPSLYKLLKSFLRGIRESRDHLTTKYPNAKRNTAYEAGRRIARRVLNRK